jgi:hypothetical protein
MTATPDFATALETPVAGLYATAPEPLPFAPSLDVRAFLLCRAEGNVLVYSTSRLGGDRPALDELGGVARHYLNHGHEAMFASDPQAPVFVHRAERDAVARAYPVRATFSRRHTLGGDLEVIPIPGHTRGATAYLWDTGEHRLLLTGDTIYLDDGQWVAAVLQSSDRAAYLESLALMRDLDFDVLVPWAATRGQPYVAMTDRDDARRRIGWIIERVRDGGAS